MAGQQTRGPRPSRFVDNGGEPTTRDIADDRRRRRARDEPIERAHRAGYTGGDRAEFETSDELAQHYDDGAALRAQENKLAGRDARNANLRSTAGAGAAKAGSVANDGAGILLGMFAYALLVNYLAGGVAGTRAWLSAKFLNRPNGHAAVPRQPTTAAAPSGPG